MRSILLSIPALMLFAGVAIADPSSWRLPTLPDLEPIVETRQEPRAWTSSDVPLLALSTLNEVTVEDVEVSAVSVSARITGTNPTRSLGQALSACFNGFTEEAKRILGEQVAVDAYVIEDRAATCEVFAN